MITSEVIALILVSSFIQILPVYSDIQHLIEEWNKISANDAYDMEKTDNILKVIKDEQLALARLHAIVEKHLKDENGEQMVNALSMNDNVISDGKLKEVVVKITKKYDKRMIDNIITQTVEKIVLTRNSTQIPDFLWSVYKENTKEHFEIMLRFQIQLYNCVSDRHLSDEKEFLQNYAYRLHKIKNEHLYNSVNMTLKSNVRSIEQKLPNILKYLYFTPYFCLENVKFKNYIYTAVQLKVDPLSRYIWLWYDNQSMDDTGYINAEVSEYNSYNGKKFKVALKGTKYQMYYYMMPDTRKIAGWDSNDTPSNHIWDLEFLDNDRVVFSQNNFLMCGVELHDDERRNIGGRKMGEVSLNTPECQWRLDECAFE